MKILHVDSSVTGPNSVTRKLTAAIVAKLTAENADAVVTYRDLVAEPVAHTSPATLAGAAPAAELADAAGTLEAFLAADVVVIGAPMYNFSVPSQLKAWLDKLAVAGKTFRYGANGPEGLAGGRRVIVASSRGGVYAPGTPAAPFDHHETYLRAFFGFLGVTDLEIVRAEGVAQTATRDAAIADAERQIAELRAA